MATIVSIGRNIGDEPMSEERWYTFRDYVYSLVRENAGPVVFAGTGTGTFEGRSEESYTVIGAEGGRLANRLQLEHKLSTAAKAFDQESIAITYGNTLFV